MGRKKKYHTIEEKNEANRRDWKIWYEKNKEKHNNQRMVEYYEKQIKELQEKVSNLRNRT